MSAQSIHQHRVKFRERREQAEARSSRSLKSLEALYDPAIAWHGPHPLNDCVGADAVVNSFWRPLLNAVPDLERREDILLSGTWRDRLWVASTGHFTGLFERTWLGIPPSKKVINIRYGEFHSLAGSQINESYLILDILDVMRQVDLWPLAPPLGSVEHVLGPATCDGVLNALQSDQDSVASLKLVEAMIAGLMRYDGKSLDSMDQSRFWHPGFMWYGPAGIGTCSGQTDYRRVHQLPFLNAFPDRVGGDHKCRIGEGVYVASTGWPSIRASHLGSGFMGLPATGRPVTMRVMDFWRREDQHLRENWVFIDLLDLLLQMGLDVFDRMRTAGVLNEVDVGGLGV
ncbi:MAG: polyketide cyclase [Rhodospirillaceae bacterium]|nr:MAG: polyketide cyclase [Rhodospirillaceae bacterium]